MNMFKKPIKGNGSWNESCCLSRLPITYKDEIVVLPVIERVLGGDSEFAGPPLYGTYDDHGSIDLDRGDKYQEMASVFSVMLQFAETQGGTLYKAQGKSSQDIAKDLCIEGIKVIQGDKKFRIVKMMMLRDVYEELIRNYGSSVYDGEQTYSQYAYEAYDKVHIEFEKLEDNFLNDYKRSDLIKSGFTGIAKPFAFDNSIMFEYSLKATNDVLEKEIHDLIVFRFACMNGCIAISDSRARKSQDSFLRVIDIITNASSMFVRAKMAEQGIDAFDDGEDYIPKALGK